MRIIDISLPLNEGTPKWPGTTGIRLSWYKTHEQGHPSNNSEFQSDTHIGTHVDAPFHFAPNGKTIDQIDLDKFIGPAYVAYLPDVLEVSGQDLSNLNLPANVTRLLLKTRNSAFWKNRESSFRKDYTALNINGAQWLVDHGIELVGIDYLSIAKYDQGPEVHNVLLGAEIIVLEGLDLSDVSPGLYELICLPLNITGAEGAPARAILRTLEKSNQ